MLNLKLKRMKSKTKFFVALAVIATLNLFFQLRVENGAPVLSQRQAMANEVYYYAWIEGEAEITCSSGGTGPCNKQNLAIGGLFDLNVQFFCEWTGSIKDNCSQLFNYAANWTMNKIGL
jgi:hypothetical protein